MRFSILFTVAAMAALTASTALADEPGKVQDQSGQVQSASDNHFHGGFDISLGVPSGAEVGFVFNPWTRWTRLELGLAHNSMSFGGIASATFTPIHFPIMPVLQVEAGFFPSGSLPGFIGPDKTLPTIGYDWLSFGPGLEFGNREHVVFFFHPALTYIHLTAGNMQGVIDSNISNNNGIQLGDATVNGWIMPTFRMGLSVMF